MLSYAEMCRHPEVFRDLTGMTRREFDTLAGEFSAAVRAARDASPTTTAGKPRENAAGAGRPHDNDTRSRLLMALFWLRVYPTYAVLGYFFGLHNRNAQLNVRAALEVLDGLDTFRLERPKADRPKANSAAKVMSAFPAVRVVIDGKEQRCNKPEGYEAQKPYYSGKKKCHTLETQVVVDPSGEVEGVTESVPGGANHGDPVRGSARCCATPGCWTNSGRARGRCWTRGTSGSTRRTRRCRWWSRSSSRGARS